VACLENIPVKPATAASSIRTQILGACPSADETASNHKIQHLHDFLWLRFQLFLTELTPTCILLSIWGVFARLAVCQLGGIEYKLMRVGRP